MPQLTKDVLLKKINELDIALEKKEELLGRVGAAREIDDALINWLRGEVQKLIDKARSGPKKIITEAMRKEMQRADRELDKEISKVSKDISKEIENTIRNFKIQPARAS